MVCPLLVIAVALSTPYTDAQKRFSLDLPAGWEQGPLAPNANGVSFRCTIGGKVALTAVRVVAASGNPVAVARKLGQAMESQAGYRLVEEGSTELDGRPAARRRYVMYVDGNPEMVKTAEDRVVIGQGNAFVIHVESLSTTFFDFELDFNHIYETFRLGGAPGKAKGVTSELVGKWLMKGTQDTFFDLRADGAFDLAGTTGTYKVDGASLLMWMSGGMEQFAWRMEKGDLVLFSSNLGEPIRYSRTEANPWVGTWEGGGRVLTFEEGKTATVDGKPASYRVAGKKLVLRVAGKKRVVRFTWKGEELVLKGWTFGKGVELKRK